MSSPTAETAETRRLRACLVILLGGLVAAAGLVYFLGRVFARWFVSE